MNLGVDISCVFVRQVVPDATEVGGLFGLVSAYSGVIQDQKRGTLHLHALVWLAGWRNVFDDLIKTGRTEDEAFAALQKRLVETMDAHIKTEIQLPEPESKLPMRCLSEDCKGELHGPSDARVAALRGVNKHHGADPKVLTCVTCSKAYGCNEVLMHAVQVSFDRLNLPSLPTGSRALRKYVENLKFELQTSPEKFQIGTEVHQAAMALIQLTSNSHDPNHTYSCGKKKDGVCRFKLPHLSCAKSDVVCEAGEDDEAGDTLTISQARHASNMYTATFTPELSALWLCNTNSVFVKSQLIAYYLAAYMSKHCRENDDAHSEIEASFSRLYDRLEVEKAERDKQRSAAARRANDRKDSDVDMSMDPADVKSQDQKQAAPASQPPLPLRQPESSTSSGTSSSGTPEPTEVPPEPTAARLGIKKLLSGISNISKGDAVAAQAAGHFLLNGEAFIYSHEFSTLPYQQGLAYVRGEDVGCRLTTQNESHASVFDYAYRDTALNSTDWYTFVGSMKLVPKKAKRSAASSATADDSGSSRCSRHAYWINAFY
jgi:hypothetical protein